MPKTVTLGWREYLSLLNAAESQDENTETIAELEEKLERAQEYEATLGQRYNETYNRNIELRDASEKASKQYKELYAAYEQLRDEANNRLMGDRPQVEWLHEQLREQEAQLEASERKLEAAWALAVKLNEMGSEQARRVRPNLPWNPLPTLDSWVRMYEAAKSVEKEVYGD